MTSLRTRLLVATTLACALGTTGVAAAPAEAGGPGQVYVYGSTRAGCEENLSNSIHSQSRAGYTISGVHHCRRTGDRTRWFGDYVRN